LDPPSKVDIFDDSNFAGDLKRILTRSVTAAFSTQMLKLVLQLVTTAVLARLLTPG